MNATSVGIDHISFYAPKQYIDMVDLAKARGIPATKYTEGIGIKEACVSYPVEDVVVLAANAGKKALEEAGVAPEDVGLLIVGTESAVDKSKPTATHVHELLGISSSCRVYDVIHACIGATYGVLSAIDWLHNADNQYALVIASDIARYGKNTLGEPTQGAGAVAMLISRSPRIISLTEAAKYSKNVYDFWKPLDEKYPLVDGMYSAECYGEAAAACYKGCELSETAAYLYHVPYPKLVQQTHSRITRLIGEGIDDLLHYKQNVASSCYYASRIGNIYTGSLWLGLISFLTTYRKKLISGTPQSIMFDEVYMFSYGSGCGAILLQGDLAAAWEKQAEYFDIDNFLDERVKISIDEYESLIECYECPESISQEQLSQMDAGGSFRYMGTKNSKRIYDLNN